MPVNSIALAAAPAAAAARPYYTNDRSQEASLGSRLQAREPAALAELYDQFGTFVYRVALGRVRDAATAENLTQETFLYIWNRIGAFDAARGSLANWVGMVARSRTIDYLRSLECRMARSTAPLEDAARCVDSSPAHPSMAQVERVRLLEGPWKNLKPCQRQALRLAYYVGLSQSEIAQRLNRPLGTIKAWTRQGLHSLRAALEGSHAL